MLEPPQLGGSNEYPQSNIDCGFYINEYPQSCFRAKLRKNVSTLLYKSGV